MLRPRLKIVFYSGTPRSETKSRFSMTGNLAAPAASTAARHASTGMRHRKR
jgi:hypothetical protein